MRGGRNVVLTEHQDELIASLIKEGRFQNANEVLRAGLRLVEQQEREYEAKVKVLREAAQMGWSDLVAGRYDDVADEDLDDFILNLGSRSHRAWSASRSCAAERVERTGNSLVRPRSRMPRHPARKERSCPPPRPPSARPPSGGTTTENPRSRKRGGEPSLFARYVGAMLYFVGAALIAGAVVHYPIDPPVYTAICMVGALVFLLGTVVNEFIFAAERPTLTRAIGLVTFSLLLSFGVGLLGGGIQHFEQFPERSAAMTPIGLLMSFAAFVAKDPQGRWRDLFSVFGAAVVLVAAATWFGMSTIADSIESTNHTHGTGETPAEEVPADQTPAQEAPSEQDGAPSGEQDEPAGDGHDSHGH